MDILQSSFSEILVDILSYLPRLKSASLVNHSWYQATRKVNPWVYIVYKGERLATGTSTSSIILRDWNTIRPQEMHTFSGSSIRAILRSAPLELVGSLIQYCVNQHSWIEAWCRLVLDEGFTSRYREIWYLFLRCFSIDRKMYSMLMVTETQEVLEQLRLYSFHPPSPDRELLLRKQRLQGTLHLAEAIAVSKKYLKYTDLYAAENFPFNSEHLKYCLTRRYYATAAHICSLNPSRATPIVNTRNLNPNLLRHLWYHIDLQLPGRNIPKNDLLTIRFLHYQGVLKPQLPPSKNSIVNAFLSDKGYIASQPEFPTYRLVIWK